MKRIKSGTFHQPTAKPSRTEKQVEQTLRKRSSKLGRLKKRSGFKGDPDAILQMDWAKEWKRL